MNSRNFRQGRQALAVTTLLGLAAVSAAPAAHANITTSGGASFITGTPTPTLTITAPITFNITASGILSALLFDEWVVADGNQTLVTASTGQTFAYKLNGVAATTPLGNLADNVNLANPIGPLSANDGILFFNGIAVIAGQTLTINPQSFTFGTSASFNPNVPTAFNGNAFITNNTGVTLTNIVSVAAVPEPSTWALIAAGALGLGAYRSRSAKRS